MNGQWIGTYSGTNNGTIVADLDDTGDQYRGVVFAYDFNNAFPRTFARVLLPKNKNQFTLKVALGHQERGTGQFLSQEAIVQRFPGVQVPTEADTEWDVNGSQIALTWRTAVGTNGHGELKKSEGHRLSNLVAIDSVKSWNEFKSFVLQLRPYQFVFRGHADSTWRLRTGFHRAGRASLLHFMEEDINTLHRHLSGLTSHRFNLGDPLDYAAFMNLAQHHGYPTPILDWTLSPFVAAYFAYRDVTKKQMDDAESVRLLIFESAIWNQTLERAPALLPGFMHMTFLEPLALNNLRIVPQQSISSVTNVDDLEEYISTIEKHNNRTYLRAIDLPASERRTVMHELSLMGITAGSLFPGLDGTCRQLRERVFGW